MQAVLAVVEVDASAHRRQVLVLPQHVPQQRGQEDAVGVDLDGPVVERVALVGEQLLPDRQEDLGVQRRLELPARVAVEVAVHEARLQPWRQVDHHVAVDGSLLAAEDGGADVVLHQQQVLLVAVGHHQREAKQRPGGEGGRPGGGGGRGGRGGAGAVGRGSGGVGVRRVGGPARGRRPRDAGVHDELPAQLPPGRHHRAWLAAGSHAVDRPADASGVF
mmetsp:Transcript_9445/g.21710  ORF Transcript_9445/g.21710 Transcript_9445/m.21710 type:complete len:219 (-) Transcript_9445:42-698(-)